MTDIFGPADAANAVTSRPTDGRTFAALDTFFKDCTSDDAEDGTEIDAAFLNGAVAALRAVARMNGSTIADPTVKIIPEVGTDDYLLSKAIQHLVQRGQPSFALDTGVANALVATLAPAAIEYKPGMIVRVKVAADCTGASTINVNGLGVTAITRADGSPLFKRDLVAGMIAELLYDGAAFQIVGSPTSILTQNTDYYVSNAGSDSNTGLDAGHAFLTGQRAMNVISTFNLNGFTVTVHFADGTYAPFGCGRINGSGSINIVGNVGTPSNVVILSTVGWAIACTGAGYSLDGVKLVSTGNSGATSSGIYCLIGNITLKTVEFGAALDAHMFADIGGVIVLNGPITVSGQSARHILVGTTGVVRSSDISPPAITFTVPMTFTNSFINIVNGSVSLRYSSINGAGNVSGVRYAVSLNGILNTLVGGGASYYPGTIAGTLSTGGQYV